MTPTTRALLTLLHESDSWALSHEEHTRLDDYLNTVLATLLYAQQQGIRKDTRTYGDELTGFTAWQYGEKRKREEEA